MATSASPAITVLAWGNESRGDDAIGPILARRIVGLENLAINIVEDHQLSIEHIMDLREDVPVLFIDASIAIDADYVLERLKPLQDASISSHSISPQALLDLYEHTLGKPAPDAYLLQVCGNSFELGETISDATSKSLDEAWLFLTGVFAKPREQWRSCFEAASSMLAD